ncbi:MAG TPA: S8 family serine peptidase, partial [Gemmatimonadaceae bacterium]|nr:S8 family serine peptidase [Gemmatimonadaceae bacterium]
MKAPRLALVTALLLAAACGKDYISDPNRAAPEALGSAAASAAISGGQGLGYIVTFDDSVAAPAAKARALAAAHGVSPRFTYQHTIKGFAAPLSDAAAQALSRTPGVRRVEADGLASINATQTGATWGIDRLDQRARPIDGSYTYNVDGAGVTAYILDTGIRFDHAEFYTSATNTTSRAVTGIDEITSGGTAADCNGHGTHVAGTVGGLKYGVAKATRLVAVRV